LSKRNKPRQFEFPDDPPLFLLKEDEIAKLAVLLGVTKADQHQKLARQLEIIAEEYLDAVAISKVTPSRGETNAAIEAILRSARDLITKLQYADIVSEVHLCKVMADNPYIQEKGLPQESGRVHYEELRCRLEHFDDILTPYLEEAKKHRGRTENTILKLTIKALINLYEELSGRTFTHTCQLDGQYTPDPRSNGGHFVQAALEHIDKNITPGSVSSILSEYIRDRNRK